MAITVAMRTQISQLYVAMFGRAPDAEGLGYWVQRLDSGESLTSIANAMFGTDPARAYFPLFLTNQEIIASFYVNVLGRTADAEGLAFWTAKLNAAGATPGSVINEMVSVVANYVANGGSDPAGLTSAALFNNKVAVAQYYGEHNGNITDATVVLATVTADPATVTAAQAAIAAGTIGQDGISVTLTTGQDTVTGTPATDEVHGIVGGAAATYTAGDTIDLGAGTSDSLNLVFAGAVTSAQVTVKNTEFINLQDTLGGTFDALLVQNSPTISFTNTQTGLTSTVVNGSTGSVYGLSGKGNLTVDFASTSGTADTAKVSLSGVGTSTTARSTVDVSDGNTIEAVTVATTGTNFVTLLGGTAAKTLTVTGNGTNNFNLTSGSALAAVSTIDASASTGTNTFNVGTNLNTTDVFKGGTGTDTVSTTLTLATQVKPTMTGVETLRADFDATATLDLSAATGLKTVTLTGFSKDAEIVKANSTVTALNILNQDFTDATADNISFAYGTGQGAPLTVTIGDATAATATNVTLADLDITGSTALTVGTAGTKTMSLDNINVAGDQTAITVNANTDLEFGQIDTDGDVDAFTINVGADVTYSGGLSGGGAIGDVVYTTADGSFAQAWISSHTGIGSITITGTGDTNMGVGVSGGNLGDITISLTGDDASGSYFAAYVSGGSVGDISISVADGANMYFTVSANSYAFDDTDEDGTDGNIGNISIAVGDDSYVSANFNASGGDIGNVTVNIYGDEASGHIDVIASYVSGDIDGDTYYDYVRGGNVGDVTVNVTGKDANVDMYVLASGGNIGNVSYNVTGDNASGWLGLNAVQATASGNVGGNIGDVSFTVGADAAAEMGLHFDETTGSVTVAIGVDGYGGIYVSGGSSGNAVLGDVDATVGVDGFFLLSVSGLGGEAGMVTVTGEEGAGTFVNMSSISGDIGGVDISMGDDSFAGARFSGNGGDLGAVSISVGDGSDAFFWVSGQTGSVGDVTLVAGDDSSVSGMFFGNADDIGSVSVTIGDGSEATLFFSGNAGSYGDVSATAGANSDVQIGFSGAVGDVGLISVAGGDSSASAGIWIWTGNAVDSIGGVDASTWAGDVGIGLAGVMEGTTIQTGTGNSWVHGTEGSDVIILGTGSDWVVMDGTPTAIDQIFQFQKAKDIVSFSGFAAITGTGIAVADNAAAMSLTDGSVYVFVDGSNTTTAETIVSFTDLTDVSAFLAAAFNDEAAGDQFIAVINTGGGSAYLYYVDYDAGGAINAAATTLIGVVAADGALTTANVSG